MDLWMHGSLIGDEHLHRHLSPAINCQAAYILRSSCPGPRPRQSNSAFGKMTPKRCMTRTLDLCGPIRRSTMLSGTRICRRWTRVGTSQEALPCTTNEQKTSGNPRPGEHTNLTAPRLSDSSRHFFHARTRSNIVLCEGRKRLTWYIAHGQNNGAWPCVRAGQPRTS